MCDIVKMSMKDVLKFGAQRNIFCSITKVDNYHPKLLFLTKIKIPSWLIHDCRG